MALWHFKFALVPAQGIVAVHGSVPAVLAEHQPPDVTSGAVDEDREFPDYWQSAGSSPSSLVELTQLLPKMDSWGEDAAMYGTADGDRIEIWNHDIHCRLDLRAFSMPLLVRILGVAHAAHCKLVIAGSGEVIDPDKAGVLQKIKQSDAFALCSDPEKYFRDRRLH